MPTLPPRQCSSWEALRVGTDEGSGGVHLRNTAEPAHGETMRPRDTLQEDLTDLTDLLNELEAGQAHWKEFGPAVLALRNHTGLFDDTLAELTLRTVFELRDAAKRKQIDRARSVVTEALSQLERLK